VSLARKAIDPYTLLAAGREVDLRFFGENQTVRAVRPSNRRIFAALREALETVLLNRLEHSEPWVTVRLRRWPHQRLVDQRFEPAEDVDLQVACDIAHGFGGVERAASDEDRQAAKQLSLVV